MSKTSRIALVAGICLLTGSAAMAQTAAPRADFKETGMDGKALNRAALDSMGTPGHGLNGTGSGQPGMGSDTAKPADAPVGLQPAPGTGAKTAP